MIRRLLITEAYCLPQSGSTRNNCITLEKYQLKNSSPIAICNDKDTVFRVPKPNQNISGMTQFGLALAELNVLILYANRSQARGRVEHTNRTVLDRLVIELRLARMN